MAEIEQIKKTFGKWLEEQIKKQGYKHKTFAEKAGLHQVSLSRIINGKLSVKRQTVVRLAECLEVEKAEALKVAGYSVYNQKEIPSKLLDIEYQKLNEEEIEEIRLFIEFKIALKERKEFLKNKPIRAKRSFVLAEQDYVLETNVKNAKSVKKS